MSITRRALLSLLAALAMSAPLHARAADPFKPVTLSATLPDVLPNDGARFGASVDGSESVMVVGAEHANEGRGGVMFWTRTGGDWDGTDVFLWGATPIINPSDSNDRRPAVPWGARLGAAVAVSGDLIAVGAPGRTLQEQNPESGQGGVVQPGEVYIFKDTRDADLNKRFVLKAIIKRPPNVGSDLMRFGSALAFEENMLIIGAPLERRADGLTGAAFGYELLDAPNSFMLVEQGMLVPEAGRMAPEQEAAFGGAVTLVKSATGRWIAAVGCRPVQPLPRSPVLLDNTEVTTFTRGTDTFDTWSPLSALTSPAGQPGEGFGHAVKLGLTSGDEVMLLVGAPGANGVDPATGTSLSETGNLWTYLFDSTQNLWLTGPEHGPDTSAAKTRYFGYALDMHDDAAFLGGEASFDAVGDSAPSSFQMTLLRFDPGMPGSGTLIGRDPGPLSTALGYVKAVTLQDTYAAAGTPQSVSTSRSGAEEARLDAGGLVTFKYTSGQTLPTGGGSQQLHVWPLTGRGDGRLGARLFIPDEGAVSMIYEGYVDPSAPNGGAPLRPERYLLTFERPGGEDAPWVAREDAATLSSAVQILSATASDGIVTLDDNDMATDVRLVRPSGTITLALNPPLTPALNRWISASGKLGEPADTDARLAVLMGDEGYSLTVYERDDNGEILGYEARLTSQLEFPSAMIVRGDWVIIHDSSRLIALQRQETGGTVSWVEVDQVLDLTGAPDGSAPGMAMSDRWLFVQSYEGFKPVVLICDLAEAPQQKLQGSCTRPSALQPEGAFGGDAMYVNEAGNALFMSSGASIKLAALDESGLRGTPRTLPLPETGEGQLTSPDLRTRQIIADHGAVWLTRTGVVTDGRFGLSTPAFLAPMGLSLEARTGLDQQADGSGIRVFTTDTPMISGTTEPDLAMRVASIPAQVAQRLDKDEEITTYWGGAAKDATFRSDAEGRWSASPNAPLGTGRHLVTITYDPDGPFERVETVEIDVRLGMLAITSPADGEELVNNPPRVEGVAPAGAKLNIVIEGQPNPDEVTADANGQWGVTLDAPLPPGETQITARVFARNDLEPVTVTVTVTREVELISVDDLDGATLTTTTPTFTGKAPTGDRISCTINDRPPLTGIVPSQQGNWYYSPLTELPVGENQLVIEQERPDGTKLPARTVFFTVLASGNRAPLQRQRCATAGQPGTPALPPTLLLLATPALLALRRRARRG